LRVAEDEVVVALVGRALEETLELAGDAVGHRDRPALVRLRRVDPVGAAAREVVGDPDAGGDPVHVAPSERQQFALS